MNVKRNTAFDKLMEEHGALPAAKQVDEESWEEATGDGRSSRHQVFGLQLVNAQKRMVWIPYSAIFWGEGIFNGKQFKFQFTRGDEAWEVTIEGSLELQKVVDRITAGKRECCRVNGETITNITWDRLESGEA